MKLVSLNVEGVVHVQRVLAFITRERPDVLCLQEAGTPYQALLQAEGYQVTFVPRCIRTHEGEEFTDGLLFASLHPATVTPYNFYLPHEGVLQEHFDDVLERNNTPGQILLGEVHLDGQTYHVGTTHFTWTKNGDIPGIAQESDMQEFLLLVSQFPPHVMCGDFNIPRASNRLYANLLTRYQDEIPATIKSSLDAEHHRLKDIPEKVHLLERYMVDYIFSQPGYTVRDVRQVFGLSDHSALVCEVG